MSDTNTTKAVKPGYKTTEFWLTLLANILLAAVTYLQSIDAVWAASGVVILNSIYALTRMGVKAAAEKAAKVVPMLLVAFSLFLMHSCVPTAYQVDTRPYTNQIETNPSKVTVEPEHVTEIGGFQAEFGAKVLTDHGEIDLSEGGVSGDVVVDIRSGK